jgi:hypothetical protein
MQHFIRVSNLLVDDESGKTKNRRIIIPLGETENHTYDDDVSLCFESFEAKRKVDPDVTAPKYVSNHHFTIEEARAIAKALNDMANRAEAFRKRFQPKQF